jgi:hypothetical protein
MQLRTVARILHANKRSKASRFASLLPGRASGGAESGTESRRPQVAARSLRAADAAD